jgi:hypothetical protein
MMVHGNVQPTWAKSRQDPATVNAQAVGHRFGQPCQNPTAPGSVDFRPIAVGDKRSFEMDWQPAILSEVTGLILIR